MATVSLTALRDALSDVDFPCDKDDLVTHAQAADAPQDVQKALRSLPLATYDNVDEVVRSVTPEVD